MAITFEPLHDHFVCEVEGFEMRVPTDIAAASGPLAIGASAFP